MTSRYRDRARAAIADWARLSPTWGIEEGPLVDRVVALCEEVRAETMEEHARHMGELRNRVESLLRAAGRGDGEAE